MAIMLLFCLFLQSSLVNAGRVLKYGTPLPSLQSGTHQHLHISLPSK